MDAPQIPPFGLHDMGALTLDRTQSEADTPRKLLVRQGRDGELPNTRVFPAAVLDQFASEFEICLAR